MKARTILRELIVEVRNPDIANGPAAMRACLAAEQLFKEEEDALQKRSAEAEVPRAGGEGGDEAGGAPRVGKGNPKRKTAGAGKSDTSGH